MELENEKKSYFTILFAICDYKTSVLISNKNVLGKFSIQKYIWTGNY